MQPTRTRPPSCLQALGNAVDNNSVHFFLRGKERDLSQVSFFNRIQTSVAVILGGSAVLLLAEMKVSPDYFYLCEANPRPGNYF